MNFYLFTKKFLWHWTGLSRIKYLSKIMFLLLRYNKIHIYFIFFDLLYESVLLLSRYSFIFNQKNCIYTNFVDKGTSLFSGSVIAKMQI